VTTWSLPNGMKVWHLQQSQLPLIALRLVFPSGSSSDPPGKAGLTGLSADLLDEGAGTLSALELGDAMQRLATEYNAHASIDGVSLSMNLLSDKLQPSMALLADITQRPHLTGTELDRRRGLWVAQAISREANPNDARTIVTHRVLFGDGYAGWPGVGTKTTLKRITLADVKKQYQAVFQPEGAIFTVVGDVTRAALDEALRQSFGKWQGRPTAKPAKVAESKWPANGLYRIDFPGSSQSSVALAQRAAGSHAGDYFPAMVFNWALGGAFGSRLNLNLREDKGYTYGARSHFRRWRGVGTYSLAAQVKGDTTKASLDEMFKELAGIGGNKPLTTKEQSDAIEGLLLGFPSRFERLDSMAGQLAWLAHQEHPADWFLKYPQRLRAVTLETADTSAKRHAQRDAFAVIVAGDLGKIGASLATLDRPVYDCSPGGHCNKAE